MVHPHLAEEGVLIVLQQIIYPYKGLRTFSRLPRKTLGRLHHPSLLAVMDGTLISGSKETRTRNSSAGRGQLTRIRGADPGQTGDDLRIVTNGNLMPGYRLEQRAGGMDPRQRIQNGRGGLCSGSCGGSGRSLMSLVSFALLAIAVVLPRCTASDPCSERVNVNDKWRDVSVTDGSIFNHCDYRRFTSDKWYSFTLAGVPGTIPTTCIKNNMCGSKVAMRVDLIDQTLPQNAGDNITASLCGSYDVLGKFDCCVLRSVVNIVRCDDGSLVYNFPLAFDRCPVALCVKEQNVQVPPESIAKMGEDIPTTGVQSTTEATPAGFNPTSPEEITAADNTSETTDETHLPPQLLVQQPTQSDPDASTSADHTFIPESSPSADQTFTTETSTSADQTFTSETSTSADQTFIQDASTPAGQTSFTDNPLETTVNNASSNKLDFESGSHAPSNTSDFSTESDNLTGQTTDAFDSINKISTLVTDSYSTDKPTDAISIETTAQSLQSSTETVTEYTTTIPTTSQEITSETSTHISSSVELLSTAIKLSSDPTYTTNKYVDMSLSTTGEIISDLLSTTSLSSENVTTSHNATHLSTVALQNLSEKATTDSFLGQTSVGEITTDITNVTSLATNSTATPTTFTTKTAIYEETTQTARPPKKELTPLPGKPKVTQEFTGAIILKEMVRFVFKGDLSNMTSTTTVLALLDTFLEEVNQLRGVQGMAQWMHRVYSISEAVNFENRTTYMEFRIERATDEVQDIIAIFRRYNLKSFLADKANLTLIAECHVTSDCQYERLDASEGASAASVFESNATAFITIIVLCSICLLVLVLALMYSRLSKRGSWKATSDIDIPENRHYISGNQSPFTDAQIMKDEMVDDTSFNGSAKDGDTNLHSTWVIPLDQDPTSPKTVVAITTEDTKF